MIFYSPKTKGFYVSEIHGDDIPSDKIEIPAGEYQALLDGQEQGWQITENEKGKPILAVPAPSKYHNLKNGKWEITPEKLTVLLNEQRALMWEKIKQKRYDNLRGGVYVKSIGKWFHSNDESRQQYTFLRTLDALPPNLMWKTMDNSFVEVTKAILDELSLQMILDEQVDFMNAERHKALMEQAENPLEYDFSSGWVKTFAEAGNE
ncbi:DUF4376 domain-containing protein [Rodentibacter trehalosifermentans]|nr:DUF4376 domain-containing protein [Rodentibacter trehalosifermentans]